MSPRKIGGLFLSALAQGRQKRTLAVWHLAELEARRKNECISNDKRRLMVFFFLNLDQLFYSKVRSITSNTNSFSTRKVEQQLKRYQFIMFSRPDASEQVYADHEGEGQSLTSDDVSLRSNGGQRRSLCINKHRCVLTG